MALATVEIGNYLVAQGVGTLGASLWLGKLPDTPPTAMAVIPYPGRRPDYIMDSTGRIAIEFPRFQFISRAADEVTALTNAQNAYEKLARVANQILGTTFYSAISILQSPGITGRDPLNRPLVTFNFEAEKEVSA